MKSSNIPAPHARFLDRALPLLQGDKRFVGVAAAGSLVNGTMDEFSDLDLIIAVEPEAAATVSNERRQIAGELGPLVASFTGEHVGEPRLLICLYEGQEKSPPLHVDLKFVSLSDAATRVDDPIVLWERDGRFSRVLASGQGRYPVPDLPWIEDRFWIWVHYATLKIGRGELFEAIDFLAFLRAQVLGPLILMEAGAQPAGVRRMETAAASRTAELKETVAAYDIASCVQCLYAAINLYRSLRQVVGPAHRLMNDAAERTAIKYLDEIAARV